MPHIITAKLDKKTFKPAGKCYAPLDSAAVTDIGCNVASTVTSHYWRGLSNDKDNLVIYEIQNTKADT